MQKSVPSSHELQEEPVPELRVPGSSTVWLWGVLMLAVGLLVTLGLCLGEQRRDEVRRERVLAGLEAQVVAGLRQKLYSVEVMLRAFQGLYSASEQVSQEEFVVLYEFLEPEVQFAGLQALLYSERQDDGSGSPRYPVMRYAPEAGNERLRQLDISTQPHSLDAVQRSEASRGVAMSAPFHLAQMADDPTRRDGVVLRLPVYAKGTTRPGIERAAGSMMPVGSLAISFSAQRFIEAAIPENVRQATRLRISDVTASPVLLYDSHPGEDVRTGDGKVAYEKEDFTYGGRQWQLVIIPLELQPVRQLASQRSFGPGVLVSLLLALLAMALANTRRRALHVGQRMSRRYKDSERRYRLLNEMMPTLVLLADAVDGRIVSANRVARKRFGQGIEQGGRLDDVLHDDMLLKRLKDSENGVVVRRIESQLRDADDALFWAALAVSRLDMDDGPRLLLVMADIQQQRLLQESLEHQARHDSLTGLHNRRSFEQHLQALLQRCGSETGRAGDDEALACGAVLFIDLDQFKLINDTSGHVAGDEALRQVASDLLTLCGDNAMVARLGGDEFGVIIESAAREQALGLAERLRQRLASNRFNWDGQAYSLGASIGVVMMDEPGLTSREVMARADMACYVAKERGRNRVHLHLSDDADIQRRDLEMEWANRLRRALDEDRLRLDYQEVRPLQGEHQDAVHVELLMRLIDVDGKEVLPGEFLPAAERYGLMPILDRWVIEQAIANFDRLHPGGKDLVSCAVNISAASLEDEGLAEHALALLKQYGLAPERITFEITESTAVRHISQLTHFISEVRAVGCRVALDDFGTGMSSFAYLNVLNLDVVKIDGHFIRNIEDDPMGLSIVRAVTEIAHQSGMQVVAEWVQTDTALEMLRGLGVDFVQGRVIHSPERVCYQR